MLMKLCSRCNKKIPYGTKYCEQCKDTIKIDKTKSNRYYDKTVRNSEDNMKYSEFYHSKAWQRVREVAVARDYALCQDCMKSKKITIYNVVHHVVSIKKNYDKRLDINNLICLCESCHQIRHKEEI